MIEEIIPVLAMMFRNGQKHIGGADHDVIYGPSEANSDEEKILKANSWHYDDEIGCWCHFV